MKIGFLKKEVMKMRELVLMAPMQIKKHLGIGNIYDLVLCDFYTKARRSCGNETFFPLLINVNGSPLEKLLAKDPSADVDKIVAELSNEAKRYGVDAIFVLRDDLDVKVKDLGVADTRCMAPVNECTKCGAIYGSDPGIQTCKHCGALTHYGKRPTLAINVRHSVMSRNFERAQYIPSKVKNRLVDYAMSLPEEYSLVLEKRRRHTLQYENFDLDPRFVAIGLLKVAEAKVGNAEKITCVCGDLVKKFLYYIFAYSNGKDSILPNTIITHGTITDAEHKKLRWQDADGGFSPDVFGITGQELRTFFITSSAMKNIVISKNSLLSNAIKMARLSKRMESLMLAGCSDTNIISELASRECSAFDEAIEKWRFPAAYKAVENFVNECERIQATRLLSAREHHSLNFFYNLYFQ